VSEEARQMLRELLAEALAGSNGDGVVPQVPAPPVAAVLRPSTWSAPPAGAEVIGGGGPPPGDVRHVPMASDEDLNRFARSLLTCSAEEREAILAGRLSFSLGAPGAGPSGAEAPPGVMRVDRGAVTERKVDEAARHGARLVLGRGAVLTPLAREKARAKGIAIERES
jgi:hypothetical protein